MCDAFGWDEYYNIVMLLECRKVVSYNGHGIIIMRMVAPPLYYPINTTRQSRYGNCCPFSSSLAPSVCDIVHTGPLWLVRHDRVTISTLSLKNILQVFHYYNIIVKTDSSTSRRANASHSRPLSLYTDATECGAAMHRCWLAGAVGKPCRRHDNSP